MKNNTSFEMMLKSIENNLNSIIKNMKIIRSITNYMIKHDGFSYINTCENLKCPHCNNNYNYDEQERVKSLLIKQVAD